MEAAVLELDRRSAYGIVVTLMWDPETGRFFADDTDECADETNEAPDDASASSGA